MKKKKSVELPSSKYRRMILEIIKQITADQKALLKNKSLSPVEIADEIKELETIKDEIDNLLTYNI